MTEPPVSINVHHQLSRRQIAQLLRSISKEEPVTVPVKAAPAKAGWKTSEFWATALVSLGGLAASVHNSLPPKYALFASAVSISAYAFSRAIAKH